MNNEELIDVKTLRPFRRFIYTIGALPSSYLMSMTYEEQLIWFCNYLSQTVIPALNNNGLAIEELQAKYIELKSFVDDYFENLDVQEEINNKLDEMAESGELADIIAQYLELATTYVYNNVSEMKLATNLVNGSFARTSGYYSYNDGGGAYYKIRTITNEDVVDEMFIIALSDNTLIAELQVENNEVNVKQCGVTGDENENDSTKIEAIFEKSYDIYFPIGIYNIDSTLTFTSHKLRGYNKDNSIIKYIGETNDELLVSSNLENVEISNLCFDLGTANDNLVSHIYLPDTEYLSIINCEFKNGYGSQLKLNGSSNVIIENCNFHDITGDTGNPGECIYCNGIENLTIQKCVCNNVMDHFLYLDGSNSVSKVYVNDNNLQYTGKENNLTNGGAIAVYGNCIDINITNNKIDHCKSGINCDLRDDITPSYITINNNLIYNISPLLTPRLVRASIVMVSCSWVVIIVHCKTAHVCSCRKRPWYCIAERC